MGSVAYPSTFMELRWVTTRAKKDKNNNHPKELNLTPAATIPVYISTNPSDINPPELRELFTVCNHSCYRFPRLDPEEPVDVDKLRVALSHSCARLSFLQSPDHLIVLRLILMVILSPLSDSFVGQMIVRRIVRMLTSRDIYDISALCSEDERITMSAGPSVGGSIEPGRQISSCFKPIETRSMEDNQQSLEWNLSLMQLAQKRYEEYRAAATLISCGDEEMSILMIQQVPSKSLPLMDRKLQRIWKLNSCRETPFCCQIFAVAHLSKIEMNLIDMIFLV
ncbi:hypothetical protein LWI29_018389 [Acer saccharum]|uniref:Glucosamine-phosphate N-acetyltransferase n=1 Tax=Acer saccharum TaxID=4024 RepID=A0AA39SP30_ACESA|nr:hypothetical protein LWI29_018389 [Acer saccharum]